MPNVQENCQLLVKDPVLIEFEALTNPNERMLHFCHWYISHVRLCKNGVTVGTKQHVWAHTKHCNSRINNLLRLYSSRLGFP